jgi:small conductance mechanosensitive channel
MILRAKTLGSVLSNFITWSIYVIAVTMLLSELGVAVGALIAGAGILGAALGFGAQNIVRDLLSGLFIVFEDQYGIGDSVDLGEASGVVESVGLRITQLRDAKGTLWYVRNGEILRVGNMSHKKNSATAKVSKKAK